jgi:hypothetical protein
MCKRVSLLIVAIAVGICCKAVAEIPAAFQKQFAILMRTYPHVNAKRFVRSPADSAWIFFADSTEAGSVEVAFQGDEVVYMVFRRGVGGVSWKQHEINGLHDVYCKTLLREPSCGDLYTSALAPQINAAMITRKDFDAKSLLSGMWSRESMDDNMTLETLRLEGQRFTIDIRNSEMSLVVAFLQPISDPKNDCQLLAPTPFLLFGANAEMLAPNHIAHFVQ